MSPAVRSRPRVVRAAVLALAAACGLGTAAQAQPKPPSPQDFVEEAGGSDAYEIIAARLALVQSRDSAVRGFAQEMIREHEAATASLRQAAERSGLKPPSGIVGAEQAKLLAGLQGLRGRDFDHEYKVQQVVAHAGALTSERGYAEHGSDPNLRRAAQADTPMIQRHLAAARALVGSEPAP